MLMPTDSRKGEDNHYWMKASRCLSTPSEPPLRPSYWLFRVATISLHISCINIVGCVVWLENTCLHRCFHRIQRVIGLTNSNITWDLALGVEWILLMVEKKSHVLLSSKLSLSLDVLTCQLGSAMITNIHFPTLHNCNRRPTPRHIRWVSRQSHQACRIDSIAFGHEKSYAQNLCEQQNTEQKV